VVRSLPGGPARPRPGHDPSDVGRDRPCSTVKPVSGNMARPLSVWRPAVEQDMTTLLPHLDTVGIRGQREPFARLPLTRPRDRRRLTITEVRGGREPLGFVRARTCVRSYS
jgi:hypothetical protein